MSGVKDQLTVSVVIPVKNEAAGLAACLDGILAQTVAIDEILVIDSGSTDGTQDIVRSCAQARLLEIAPGDFNHGETRNLGVRETSGDLVLFTVGDARPVDDRWIERMRNGFVAEDVAAVGGLQVVAHDPQNNPLDWYRPVSEPVRSVHRFGGAGDFDAASPTEKQNACVIDDVTSMYRRSFIAETPFRHTVYGEDMLICIDALRRASARRITAVLPYFGYARQDRKPGPRTPISARLVANLIEKAGADRVLTVDLHAGQIQGFFDIPTDNLYGGPALVSDIKDNLGDRDLMVVSPDVGGVVRARYFAKRLDADLAIVDKRREQAGVSEVMNVIGDVDGRHCILVDDIVDSAGTLCNASTALLERGALSVSAYVSHGVLSGGAVKRVSESSLESLVVTDSIRATDEVENEPKIRQVPIGSLLAEAIKRISTETSVSSLFD